MLRLAQEREYLIVIDDQIGGPTGADLLADVGAHAVRAAMHRPQLLGLYHLAATGQTSWHGYACFVIERARGQQRFRHCCRAFEKFTPEHEQAASGI